MLQVLLLLACNRDVAVVIDSSGGVVAHPDGAWVELPPGALAEPTEITITRLDPATLDLPDHVVPTSPFYDFGPDGQEFLEPVEIGLPLHDGALAEGGAPLMWFYDDELELWRIVHAFEDLEHWSGGNDQDSIWASSLHFTPIGSWVEELGAPFTVVSANGISVEMTEPSNCTEQVRAGMGGAVEGIVLHSTDGGTNTARMACYLADRGSYDVVCTVDADCAANNWGTCSVTLAAPVNRNTCSNGPSVGAHYLIGRDGVIVRIVDPGERIAHAGGRLDCTTTTDRLNDVTIGIELLGRQPGVDEPYPGAQMAALQRLTAYLVDEYGVRPVTWPRVANDVTGATPNTFNAHTERVLTHEEVDGCTPNRTDPAGDWRDGAFWRAMQEDPGGQILTPGGDAQGLHVPGNAGDITLMEDGSAAVLVEVSAHLEVAAGDTDTLAGGTHDYDDVIVDGTLLLTGDVVLNVKGTFFVSEDGLIQGPGHDLEIQADGLALVSGIIDLSGTHGYTPLDSDSYGDDIDACWYDIDPTVEGPGGDGGSFTLVTRAGPLFVPTLVALGGDASHHDERILDIDGGAGGIVTIVGEDSEVRFGGDEPWPGVWTQSTRGKTWRPAGCQMDDKLETAIQLNRPTMVRGAITAGGAGPKAYVGASDAAVWGDGGDGGAGGDVTITGGAGRLVFNEWTVFTGTATNRLFAEPFLGSQGMLLVYTGSLGGNGASGSSWDGGWGGKGGDAGHVTIAGTSNTTVSGGTQDVPVWDNENGSHLEPGFDEPTQVAGVLEWWHSGSGGTELTVCAVGGSGGALGGSTSDHPGWMGFNGANGTVSVGLTAP